MNASPNLPSPHWIRRAILRVFLAVTLLLPTAALSLPFSPQAFAKDGGGGNSGHGGGGNSGKGGGSDSSGKGGGSGQGDSSGKGSSGLSGSEGSAESSGRGRGSGDESGDDSNAGDSSNGRSNSGKGRRGASADRRDAVVWSSAAESDVAVRYADGWSEAIEGTRYTLRDPARRIVSSRPARRGDLARLRALAQ